MSVANSPLVKTAIAGGDANWGRIVMAVSQSIDQSCLAIAMGGITIASDGDRVEGFDETPVTEHMAATTSPFRCALVTGRVPPMSGL